MAFCVLNTFQNKLEAKICKCQTGTRNPQIQDPKNYSTQRHYGSHVFRFFPLLLQCRTPYAVAHSLVLLKMGIMMHETCWDRRLTINIRLVASCWVLSLHPKINYISTQIQGAITN